MTREITDVRLLWASVTKDRTHGTVAYHDDTGRVEEVTPPFDLHAEIRKQRAEGAAVIAPLSMLRCSECGDLLDAYGCCVIHGLLDTEAMDGWDASDAFQHNLVRGGDDAG